MKPTVGAAFAAAALLLAARAVPALEAGDPAAVARIGVEEFKRALDKREVITVDVRGIDSYRAGHIPGALLMPAGSDAGAKADELRKSGKTIVTYCA